MNFQRLSATVFTVIAIVSILLAAATIWLFLTNPVTVANAVNEGDVSPLIRNLAQVIYQALSGLLKYL
jgi:hypothetical protein